MNDQIIEILSKATGWMTAAEIAAGWIERAVKRELPGPPTGF